jgi:hypothetical protein
MSKGDKSLREMAAVRGFRLVKSRIRTPGRRDYGKYGLRHDDSGKEAFGFSRHRLTASVEEIEAYLKDIAEAGWKASLRKAGRKAGKA